MLSESTLQTIEVRSSPDRCFEVAANVENYPEWVGGVREVEVLDRDDQGRPARATLVMDAIIRQIKVTLLYDYDPPRTIRWTAEPGQDIRELDGSYEFHEIEKGTEVVYMLRVVPSFNVPGFLRNQAEKQIVGMALRGLRSRVEDTEDT